MREEEALQGCILELRFGSRDAFHHSGAPAPEKAFSLKGENLMQRMSTQTHGVFDYIVGALLIIAPWLLGFADGGAAMWTAIGVGIVILLSSIMTNYELGLVHVIPMKGHLALDVAAGLFLALSPWLFAFSAFVFWPHLVVGIFLAISGLITQPISSTERQAYGGGVGGHPTHR